MAEANTRLDADNVAAPQRQIEAAADMRYKGQAFELTIPMSGEELDAPALDRLIDDFHAMHLQRFTYANEGTPVEVVSLRITAIGVLLFT